MEFLSKNGARLNERPGPDFALMLAADKRYRDTVQVLSPTELYDNAKIYAKSALAMAAGNGHRDIVELLKKARAKDPINYIFKSTFVLPETL